MKLNLIARYGTLITSAILLLIAVMSWFIKYPETVAATAKLSGANAPKPIIARQNLRLLQLLKENNEVIIKGDIIGVLESTGDYKEVLALEEMLHEISLDVEKDNKAAIKNLMQHSFNHLGELQPTYQSLIQAYIPYRDYVLGDYAGKKKALLQKDINIVHRSRNVLHEQHQLQQKDLGLTETTMDRNKKLLDEKLISEQEYRELSSQYISKQMSEPQMRSSYIGNESQANAIEKELAEIDNQIITQRSLFQQAVLQTQSQIESWKQSYLLMASASGNLVFAEFIQENQNLDAGKVIAYIVPDKSGMYLTTLVPQTNFGKVAKGQKVILKFDAYPWQEFGTVTGKIDYINAVPTDSGYYLAKVILPDNLYTNYKKEIPFVEGLLAHCEIVTKDLRLAENLYYDLVKTIRK